MAARKRARRRAAVKKPGGSQAVLKQTTKAAASETMKAKREIDLHLKNLQKFLARLLTHIHK